MTEAPVGFRDIRLRFDAPAHKLGSLIRQLDQAHRALLRRLSDLADAVEARPIGADDALAK
jgi:hypothetical protein